MQRPASVGYAKRFRRCGSFACAVISAVMDFLPPGFDWLPLEYPAADSMPMSFCSERMCRTWRMQTNATVGSRKIFGYGCPMC